MRAYRPTFVNEPLPRLIAMAEAWDVALDTASPKELVEALLDRVQQPEAVEQARAALPESAQSAFDALLLAEGRMPVATFERRFGAIRPMGPARLERERPWHTPANAAEVLWYRGFIARGFDRATPPVDVIYIPSELVDKLHPPQPAVETVATHTGQPLDAAPGNTDERVSSDLLEDVITLLAHVQNNDVPARTAGHSRLLHALEPQLQSPDATRFEWLLATLQAAGLLRLGDDRVLHINGRPASLWLQSTGSAQLGALREAWLDNATWNDLAHVPGLLFDRTHAWQNNPVPERRAIVAFLAENPTADADALKRAQPDFMRPDGRYDTWHIKDAATGALLHGFEHWHAIEGGLFRCITQGPLRWLAPEAAGMLADFATIRAGVVIAPRNRRYERFQLARIADPVAREGDAGWRYLITAASLARGREQGIPAARVMEFLQRHVPAVPPGLLAAIRRWDERGVEARMSRVLLLRTRDAAALDALLRHPAMARIAHERVAPNAIAIKSDEAAVREAALEAGVLLE